jgi:hypothetical protein
MRCEQASYNRMTVPRQRRVAHWQSAAATRQRSWFDSFRAYQHRKNMLKSFEQYQSIVEVHPS